MSSIPTATISRLVTYWRILNELERQDVTTISSDRLAEEAQVSAFQVRKDLAYFGRFGTRGSGYTVKTLQRELRRILGMTRPWAAAIVGMGRLGQAIADYPNYAEYEFELKAGFDIDPQKVGATVAGLTIYHPDDIDEVVRSKGIDMGVITTPPDVAQQAADTLVAAGVRGILNFAPTVLDVAKEVHVETVDFLAGLKRLSFYILNPQLQEELVS